ncbi:MAG: class I cytochrome c [Hydrogenophilales bacterium CG_4_9_14_3_um_filter_59_35]|nr:MAG: class I cytochrome c [Hydrogenophilales bacterium CG18_big_fil_WC_8_21_14_2_50_58_12]PIX99745.1 MAG: class I cytochrome c [Hydrogenophilales bacterium CG_4_10_14_3_um_filter_58_23]PJB07911.1 MAG: class I cytochrome c [Hydrogenophilales bacterium CG_4_9_14_3_um_filter_59_35]
MNKMKLTLLAFTTLALTSSAAFALDDAGREALMKDSKCLKCHAVDKDKDGPSFKKTAAKYKGKADAEQKLYTHVTTGPKIKVDGEEEEHVKIKTTNEADIKAVVTWILAQ